MVSTKIKISFTEKELNELTTSLNCLSFIFESDNVVEEIKETISTKEHKVTNKKIKDSIQKPINSLKGKIVKISSLSVSHDENEEGIIIKSKKESYFTKRFDSTTKSKNLWKISKSFVDEKKIRYDQTTETCVLDIKHMINVLIDKLSSDDEDEKIKKTTKEFRDISIVFENVNTIQKKNAKLISNATQDILGREIKTAKKKST